MQAVSTQNEAARFSYQWALLWLGFLLLWFTNVHTTYLLEPDEGRYAEIPREMLVFGDWVTPRLDGIVYLEKPPLQYWITAAAYRVLGVAPWVSRLWTWTSSYLGVLITLLAGTRLLGPRAGRVAALVLMSSPLYFLVGHINTLDAGLTFFMTAALFAFLVAKTSPDARSRRLWMLTTWGATALAVLTKGPVALVIPAITMVIYAALDRSTDVFRGFQPLSGGALLTLIAAPWFVAVSVRNPEFPRFFFLHENLARYATTQHGRVAPAWFFTAILLGGMLPWLWPMLRAWYSAVTEHTRERFSPLKFAGLYAAVVLVFFSASGSKLVPYVTPAMPALSLLVAGRLDRDGQVRSCVIATAVGGGLLLAGMPYLLWRTHGGPEASASLQYAPWILAAGLAWVLGALLAALGNWKHQVVSPAVCLAAGCVVGLGSLVWGLKVFAATRSAQPVAEALERAGARTGTVYTVGAYLQGLPFYLNRTVVVAQYTGELEVMLATAGAISPTPQRLSTWLPSIHEFAEQWRTDTRAFAVIDRGVWDQVSALGLPLQPLYADSRVIAVAKP
jgi:4-amino-4-deoxy-L-arabinose transferase-like glycosyltransferase